MSADPAAALRAIADDLPRRECSPWIPDSHPWRKVAAGIYEGLDLAGLDFSKACLFGCVFDRCDFSGADFSGAVFDERSEFRACQLADARFDRCSGGKAGFFLCFCWDASFRDVTASGWSWALCDLCGADFSGAMLSSAAFGRCDLSGIRGKTEWQRNPAKVLEAASLPWDAGADYLAEAARQIAMKRDCCTKAAAIWREIRAGVDVWDYIRTAGHDAIEVLAEVARSTQGRDRTAARLLQGVAARIEGGGDDAESA